MAKKEKASTFGACALCGREAELTFEHIPPQCAFNKGLIYVQKHEHLTEQSSPLYGKHARSPKGFGKQSLCAACNNSAGDWYVREFCAFAQQGMNFLEAMVPEKPVAEGEYTFQPLNVLKQILMMFISADTAGVLRAEPGLVDYLLDKTSRAFPEGLEIYLYGNKSPYKRLLGYSAVADFPDPAIKYWSEINYQPFGYFLTYKSPPPNQFMTCITSFKDFEYGQTVKAVIPTAYLAVSSALIGHYDNLPG